MLKKLLLTVACIGLAASSYGQGTVIFDTQNITGGSARSVDSRGNGLSGAAFSGQLYSAAGVGAAEDSLTAAESRVQFRTGSGEGYVVFDSAVNNAFTGQPVDPEVTVTPTLNGAATVQMRAWDSAFPTYEAAVAGGGQYGKSAIINLAATGGGLLPGVELTGMGGTC